MELGKIGGALVTPQQLTQHGPGKLGYRTEEENMIGILKGPTKQGRTIGRAMADDDMLAVMRRFCS
jgi:hypothetical protein